MDDNGKPGPKPRNAQNADEPGSYSLIAHVSQPLIYPGDKIISKLYICGYGFISGVKLQILLPPGLHDPDNSFCYFDLNQKSENLLTWGGKKTELIENITIILTGGPKADAWEEPSLFVDMDSQSNRIWTESEQDKKAPVELEIQINKTPITKIIHDRKNRLRSGSHIINFVFTYYNGEEWVSKPLNQDIVLISWYKRHEFALWVVGILVALAGIILAAIEAGYHAGLHSHLH